MSSPPCEGLHVGGEKYELPVGADLSVRPVGVDAYSGEGHVRPRNGTSSPPEIHHIVIPANAGIQGFCLSPFVFYCRIRSMDKGNKTPPHLSSPRFWIPAFAGMTAGWFVSTDEGGFPADEENTGAQFLLHQSEFTLKKHIASPCGINNRRRGLEGSMLPRLPTRTTRAGFMARDS